MEQFDDFYPISDLKIVLIVWNYKLISHANTSRSEDPRNAHATVTDELTVHLHTGAADAASEFFGTCN